MTPKISNISQYCNKSIISGTSQSWASHYFQLLILYHYVLNLIPVETDMDCHDRIEKIMFVK